MRTVVIYVYTERSDITRENLCFFVKNGVVPRDDIDYILVINGETKIESVKGMKVVKRKNEGGDFGGWGEILNSGQIWDHYIFINDTCRGPFLPRWCVENHWVDLFCSKLGKIYNGREIKLVGPTINHCFSPHIQSYCMATDKEGIQEMIRCGIFDVKLNYITQKDQIIQTHEVGASKCITNKGWGLYSFLLSNEKHISNGDVQYKQGLYYGITPNPIEIMFIKTTCINDMIVRRYTEWLT